MMKSFDLIRYNSIYFLKSLRWWWWWAIGTIDSTLVLRLGLDWTGLGLGLDNFDFIIGMTLATKEILFAHYLDINLQSGDLTLMQKQSKDPPNCLLKIHCPVLMFF